MRAAKQVPDFVQERANADICRLEVQTRLASIISNLANVRFCGIHELIVIVSILSRLIKLKYLTQGTTSSKQVGQL
jgi:hypothetical protein